MARASNAREVSVVTKAVQAPPPQTNEGSRASNATLKAIITMVIEMIPGGLGPWGIGDIVTAIEAFAGRTLDGLHLSMSERLVYLGASAIPVVPARPILAAYRWLLNQRQTN
jgi:hypothetical protein